MDNYEKTQPEHETHTAALVMLVIATIIISFVALTWQAQIESELTPADDEATTTEEQAPAASSHGSIIPQSAVATTESNSIADFPSGLYINEATISRNYTAPAGAGSQHVVIFSAGNQSAAELEAGYRQFLSENDFALTQEISDQYGQKLVGSRAGEQLTIAITHANDAASRVMLSFLTNQ